MKDAMKVLCKVCLLVAFFLTPLSALAQAQISGQVVDATGETVIGATIVEKGNPKNAAVTDFDGNFSIKVAAGKTLVISYVGMKTQEVPAAAGMKVVMEDDNASLDEVVVVGYTSKARKDLTGSVGSVSGAKLAVVPVSSAAEALQGKIAGVQITTVDGQPGADINIRVRGATSVTQSNDPLFIVDGFQVPNINDIPPTDIASIDVLKDASLTAIYGAKGGNGVVIVTTKSAQAGKVQVTFNGRLTTAALSRSLDLMNTGQFVDFQYDRAAANGTRSSWAKAFRGNFGNPMDNALYAASATKNWQDEVLGENPLNYSANVTVGGGNESTRFNLSLTQSEDKGIILGSGVRRTNINLKLNTKITKNLELTYNPKMTYRRDEGAGGSQIGSRNLVGVLRYQPTAGLRDWGSYEEMENIVDAQRFKLTNPVSDISTNTQKGHSYNVSNQFALQWTPIEGLRLRSEGNYNIAFRETQRFQGWATDEAQKAIHEGKPVAALTNRRTETYTWTNTATYDMSIKDVHNLSFLLGQEIYNTQYRENKQTAHKFADLYISSEDALNNMALGEPYAAGTYTRRSTANRTASFFGQATYNYNHKYLLAATFRADGSSKFAPGNQWGYFPSFSGAWVVSQEKFLKDVKWIDQLKIRASWGLSGNNNISDDLWRFLYSSNSDGGPGFGEATSNGELYYSTPGKFSNTDIKWETTVARNLAADISLFGGRLSITPEFYWNTTKDLLYDSTIPSVSGYTRQMQNIGKVQNNGWELTVNGDIVRGKDYVVSANFTLGHNKMTIKKLNATDNIIYNYYSGWYSSSQQDYVLEVGNELGLFYGYKYDGLYTWDEFTYPANENYLAVPKNKGVVNGIIIGGTVTDGYENNSGNGVLSSSNSGYSTLPGKIKIKDLNGDGQIDENDRTVIGRTTPKWQGGFGLSGQWKDFDFSANFVYMLDFDVYNANAYALSSSSSSQYNFWNAYAKFAGSDRWRYTDPVTGECLYKAYYLDDQPNVYRALNANTAKYWNPADVVNNIMLDYFVEDGSFIRCTDVTIGYTLPANLTKKIGINKVRAYVSGSNLFILTKYSGYDPEVDIQSGLTPNMDWCRYPRNRSFSFGLNVTF